MERKHGGQKSWKKTWKSCSQTSSELISRKSSFHFKNREGVSNIHQWVLSTLVNVHFQELAMVKWVSNHTLSKGMDFPVIRVLRSQALVIQQCFRERAQIFILLPCSLPFCFIPRPFVQKKQPVTHLWVWTWVNVSQGSGHNFLLSTSRGKHAYLCSISQE